jgi:NAD/NADP transhydrogenase beta subunit
MLSGLSINLLDFLGLFLFIAGFVIGLGAVTVIDIHGFLGRKSSYWTIATTRTHKVTKPMIWAGIILAIIGGVLFYRNAPLTGIPLIHAVLASVLILNGFFLSFKVSPYMLEREKNGHDGDLLPSSWQNKIMISLIFSDIGWWGSLVLLVIYILSRHV